MSDLSIEQAIAEMRDMVYCRCHPGFKDRGLHDPDCHCDSAEAVEVLARILPAVQPDALHKSFPEAGDGRPFPPMMNELMTAGLNAEDARFVAVQLHQNGYSLTKQSKSLFSLTGEP